MLDLRYHVASLSAVFIALIVGILVGVGISGRGFVDKSERRNFQNQIAALQSRVDQLSAQKALLAQQGAAAQTFAQDTYPVLMHNRLATRRIALIVIGSAGGAGGDAKQALTDAGATTALYRVIKLPVAAKPMLAALKGSPGFRKLDTVGQELAQEWVTPGVTPISDIVSPLVVEEQRGSAGKEVDAIVVLEGDIPSDPQTKLFVDGLYTGLARAGMPLVGAEKSNAAPSDVPLWRGISGMSSVDDVDTPSGKLALALLLAGAPGGTFGVRPDADAALPRIEPGG
jgi:copper transport outer membrane protein MctB